jgi:hypothetical protein
MNAQILIELPAGDGPVSVGDALEHQRRAIVALPGTSDDDARGYLAREHYFRTWERAQEAAGRMIDRRFEAAADAIVAGDLATLGDLLDPSLARARSAYGHRQTLLQHCAANGIEWPRQRQTPTNICDAARMLLDAGAEPDATCESYRGDDTAMTLLCSSSHPAEARMQAGLVETLVAGGAAVDGPNGDSAPLWTAIVWGYPAAADALARAGARMDNLVLAAGAGNLEHVKELVDGPHERLRIVGTDKWLEAEHMISYALIYAAGCNRRDVVEFLLTRGPDLTITDPIYGGTALGFAKYEHPAAGRPHGYPEIVALLSR